MFRGDEKLKGAITMWENEYLEVTLFEGLPSCTAVLGKYGYIASAPFASSAPLEILIPDIKNGEKPCVSFAYINYQLKEEVIEKLKLNDKKL